MKDFRFAKLVVFVNSVIPLILLLWDVYRNRVGANPLEDVNNVRQLQLVFKEGRIVSDKRR